MNIQFDQPMLASKLVEHEQSIIGALNLLSLLCYANSANHGFWPADSKTRNKGEQVALIHSEVSELLEATRSETMQPSEHVPHITAEAEELADIIVRTCDWAGGHGIDLGGALIAKFKYNLTRPVKHGKKF